QAERNAANHVTESLIRELLENAGLQQALDAYFAAHRMARQEELIKRLPVLFDAVEMELNHWTKANGTSEQTSAQTRDALDRVRRRVEDWQNRCGITRIAPQPGEQCDEYLHEVLQTQPAQREQDTKKIVRVEQTGYAVEKEGADGGQEVLRKARVVVWSKPESS
ncbi:MAG: nucleotide exchange factor GrpE, partial [Pirellulaceae bacterium]